MSEHADVCMPHAGAGFWVKGSMNGPVKKVDFVASRVDEQIAIWGRLAWHSRETGFVGPLGS